MSKRFFSAESFNGSETSYGFSNDTIVRVFSSKKARDNYVFESQNLSCEAIKFADVTRHATNYSMTKNEDIRPKPFHGEYWCIAPDYAMESSDVSIDGYIGVIEIGPYGGSEIERLYK